MSRYQNNLTWCPWIDLGSNNLEFYFLCLFLLIKKAANILITIISKNIPNKIQYLVLLTYCGIFSFNCILKFILVDETELIANNLNETLLLTNF